ncbi:hypothetical protein NXT3_CH01662 [Sinorhizobium fredii]|uniref:Uncharacterized protein n=1 Tax=Rhizobium fredii TaxID=380 RepID=A0A2L0H479_RHIFR|nr:hypothetical protein NXT3_CH01662 [Sinorhizobium fredii]
MSDNIISLKPWIDRLQAAERIEQEYLAERDEQRREVEEQLDNWDLYLGSRGLTYDDGPEDPDGAFITKVDREVNRVMAEFEDLVDRQVRDQDDALAALDDIRRALDPNVDVPARVVRDPSPDAPLNVLEVLCLPELGGQLYVGEDTPGTPSRNIKEKTIRGAWDRGDLGFLMLGKNKFTTRSMIKEWLEGCREKSKNLISSKESPATTKPASSPTKAPGSSNTEASKLRQAALSRRLKNLR